MIKRTEGVSSTAIVGRMLMCVRDANRKSDDADPHLLTRQFSGHERDEVDSRTAISRCDAYCLVLAFLSVVPRCFQGKSHMRLSHRFLPTSRRIVQFSSGRSAPPGARVVYIDGAWDLFHVGHIKILQEARKHGDFLLVGLHSDEDVSERRGPHLPIMSLPERSLSVLACRFVDEIVMGMQTVQPFFTRIT